MPAKLPYLIHTSHRLYHFRIVVPEPLRPAIGLSQIRRSLHARNRREAAIRVGRLLEQAPALFHQARQGIPVDLAVRRTYH